MEDRKIEVKAGVASVKNVSLLSKAIARGLNRDPNLPGMLCFNGPSGYGKTSAAAFAANEFGAYHVEMAFSWTQKRLCEAICREMGLPPGSTVAEMCTQIAEQLALSGRPLIVDEADYAVRRGMVELLREFHDKSQGVVVLIGEETLPLKLKKWERVHSRVFEWVSAQPANLEDARALSQVYCPKAQVADDLLEKLVGIAKGSARRITVNLDRVRAFSTNKHIAPVTLKDWGKQELYTGSIPAARRLP